MKHSATYTIFHIYRKDGTPLFLHPFQNPSFMGELLKELDGDTPPVFKGLYGKEPRVESLTFFRNELYRIIEQSVNGWMAEKRFIPRFLFSALVFLVTYFFCAVVIRDPIPMIDEILIGTGTSIAAYFLMGRSFKNSNVAGKKRIQMREIVDKIVFEQSGFLLKVEDVLQTKESLAVGTLMEDIIKSDPSEPDFSYPDSSGKNEEAYELLRYLEAHFDKDIVKWHEKSVASVKSGSAAGKAKPGKNVRGIKKVDLPLFSTYAKLKEFCRK
ncbi:MAG: hypothetical protein JEY99_08010 [Spirochaetales bacterium]|nr:hypothetical protein [Spirochaetales bacterium]